MAVQRFDMELSSAAVADARRTAEQVYTAITTLPIYRHRSYACSRCEYNQLCLVALGGGDEDSAKRTLYLKRTANGVLENPSDRLEV